MNYMGQMGRAMGVTFELDGREFIAFNGGPKYSFTPATRAARSAPCSR